VLGQAGERPQQGGGPGADLSQGGGPGPAAARVRRSSRLAGALFHPAVLDRDDQRALGPRLPHPAGGVEPEIRLDVRRHRRGGGAGLRERSAPAAGPAARPRLAGRGEPMTILPADPASALRRVTLPLAALLTWEAAARKPTRRAVRDANRPATLAPGEPARVARRGVV